MSEKPRQKKKRKAEKLHLTFKKKWETIIKDVDKHEVPVNVLDTIRISLIDGTSIIINIQQLIAAGEDPDDIEDMLNIKFEDLNDYIESIDFHVDIDQVAKTVQPVTDNLLRNL